MEDLETTGQPVVPAKPRLTREEGLSKAFQVMGAMHVAFGLAAWFFSLILVSLGPEHRDIFLEFAAAPVWCNVPVIMAGVLGILTSRKMDCKCMRVWFGIISLLNAFVFMVVNGALVGIYGYYYYGVIDYVPVEANIAYILPQNPGHTFLVTMLLILAGLEVLVALASCLLVGQVKQPAAQMKANDEEDAVQTVYADPPTPEISFQPPPAFTPVAPQVIDAEIREPPGPPPNMFQSMPQAPPYTPGLYPNLSNPIDFDMESEPPNFTTDAGQSWGYNEGAAEAVINNTTAQPVDGSRRRKKKKKRKNKDTKVIVVRRQVTEPSDDGEDDPAPVYQLAANNNNLYAQANSVYGYANGGYAAQPTPVVYRAVPPANMLARPAPVHMANRPGYTVRSVAQPRVVYAMVRN